MPVLQRQSQWARSPRGWITSRSLLVLALLSATLVTLPGAARASVSATGSAVPALTVSVVPETGSMLPGEQLRAAVIIDNSTAVAFFVTGLDILAPPRLRASPEEVLHLPGTIAAGSSMIVHLDVLASAEVKDAQVGVAVRFRGASKGSPERSATANFTVSVAPLAAPTLAFLVAPETLNDGEVRVTKVRIDNPSGREYTDLSLAALNGDDVSITLKGKPIEPFAECAGGVGMVCLSSLQAGTSATVVLQTRAASSVRTGTQTVGLVLKSTPSGGLPRVTATATHDVKLAVFGVDALSPFGIGALFVLPGLLAVVFFLLGNALYPRTKSLPDQADLKDLRQMPAVVAVSAAAYLSVFVLFGSDLPALLAPRVLRCSWLLGQQSASSPGGSWLWSTVPSSGASVPGSTIHHVRC